MHGSPPPAQHWLSFWSQCIEQHSPSSLHVRPMSVHIALPEELPDVVVAAVVDATLDEVVGPLAELVAPLVADAAFVVDVEPTLAAVVPVAALPPAPPEPASRGSSVSQSWVQAATPTAPIARSESEASRPEVPRKLIGPS